MCIRDRYRFVEPSVKWSVLCKDRAFVVVDNGLLNSQAAIPWLYVKLAPAPPIVIPAPLEAAESADESANSKTLSLIVTVVELIVVCVPSTWRFPKILTVPVLSPIAVGSISNKAGPCILWKNGVLEALESNENTPSKYFTPFLALKWLLIESSEGPLYVIFPKEES